MQLKDMMNGSKNVNSVGVGVDAKEGNALRGLSIAELEELQNTLAQEVRIRKEGALLQVIQNSPGLWCQGVSEEDGGGLVFVLGIVKDITKLGRMLESIAKVMVGSGEEFKLGCEYSGNPKFGGEVVLKIKTIPSYLKGISLLDREDALNQTECLEYIASKK